MSENIRVLMGDDNINDRELMKWGFEQVCPNVILDVATSGDAVIRYLEDASHPLPALVILDSMMPKLDGFAVLAWLRAKKEFDHMPVVMISGNSFEKNVARARELRATDFIVKPEELAEIKKLAKNLKERFLDS